MRKIFAVCVLMITFGLAAAAQDYSKREAFAGFQYTNLDTFNIQRSSMLGWNVQVTDYLKKPLGLTVDVSGMYGSPNVGGFSTPLRSYSVLFGPTFRSPLEKSTPFVHALFGFSHLSNSGGSYSSSGFAYELGGGFDVKVSESVAFRVAQIDYFRTSYDDATNSGNNSQNHIRIATGLVFEF